MIRALVLLPLRALAAYGNRRIEAEAARIQADADLPPEVLARIRAVVQKEIDA